MLQDRVEGRYRSLRRTVAAAAMWPSARLRHGRRATYLVWARRISGWTTTEEALALMETASSLPDHAVIVEVGSFLGQSSVVLAGARKLKGSGRVHCIDPFDASGDGFSEPYYRRIAAQSSSSLRARFDRHIAQAGLREWIDVHQGTAEAVGTNWTQPIDFLHLDGDQSPDGARRAFDAFLPFLKPGGVVALHNSSDRPYHDGHDGQRRLVVERLRPPRFLDVRCVGSTTFASQIGGSSGMLVSPAG